MIFDFQSALRKRSHKFDEQTPLLIDASSPAAFVTLSCDIKPIFITSTISKMGTLHYIKQRMANRVVLVDVLSALFGMGSWLSVNGLYTQLPLLVDNAPEAWKLSSYIVILCQAANVGLIIYDLIQRFWRKKVSDEFLIYLFMSIGCVALLLMAFFYSHITEIGGSRHSLALLILVFACALVACTSSVLFIPYMNRYRETYLISYMIGEGLSAFITSIISLLQGVGGNPTCLPVNASDPNSKLERVVPPPNFSVTTYLIILSGLQALSLLAFFLLKTLPMCIKERVTHDLPRSRNIKNNNDNGSLSQEVTQETQGKNTVYKNFDDDNEVTYVGIRESRNSEGHLSSTLTRMDHKTYVLLLSIQIILSTVANGLFPSIQTYSCLPYGNVAYHLSINLGSMANPLACYILLFISFTSLPTVSFLFSLGFAVAVYIFYAATMSPTPPLVGTASGEVLVVLSWIFFTGLVSYVKLAIATRFRKNGGKGLFWYGTITQIGAAAGAVIGFVLLNYSKVFIAYEPC